MAKKLNPDGQPVDVPTELPGHPPLSPGQIEPRTGAPTRGRASTGEDPTAVAPGKRPKTSLFDALRKDDGVTGLPEDDVVTLPATQKDALASGKSGKLNSLARPFQDSGEPRTQIAGPWRRRVGSQPKEDDPMADPVVGWLVVVAGPGKGSFVRLGPGQNSVGRGESARVRLDFGDEQISRDGHVTVTFDARGKQFYIAPGWGRNIAYMDEAPVLAPMPLVTSNQVVLGETTLRFVALCGEDFTW